MDAPDLKWRDRSTVESERYECAADLRSVLSRRAHAPTLKLAIKRLSSCTVSQSQHHDPSPRARRHSMGFAHLRTSSLSDRVYRLA